MVPHVPVHGGSCGRWICRAQDTHRPDCRMTAAGDCSNQCTSRPPVPGAPIPIAPPMRKHLCLATRVNTANSTKRPSHNRSPRCTGTRPRPGAIGFLGRASPSRADTVIRCLLQPLDSFAQFRVELLVVIHPVPLTQLRPRCFVRRNRAEDSARARKPAQHLRISQTTRNPLQHLVGKVVWKRYWRVS
jgi:hypothetical protein